MLFHVLFNSIKQCPAKDKSCRCDMKKGGTTYPTPIILFMGFRWGWECCVNLPKLPEPPGSANIRLQISWKQIFCSKIWGGVVIKISCTSWFKAAGNETKVIFQDFSTWPQLESLQMSEKGHMFTYSHPCLNTHKGPSSCAQMFIQNMCTEDIPLQTRWTRIPKHAIKVHYKIKIKRTIWFG